jgi:hypothetical protein
VLLPLQRPEIVDSQEPRTTRPERRCLAVDAHHDRMVSGVPSCYRRAREGRYAAKAAALLGGQPDRLVPTVTELLVGNVVGCGRALDSVHPHTAI